MKQSFRKQASLAVLVGLALSVSTATMGQHLHLNVGAQSQAQNTPLFFQNAASFATNSGFVLPLPLNTSGNYAGHYATASLTPAVIGTGFANAPAPGTQARLRFVSVTGPAGGSFNVWDVPGFNENEDPATAITFGLAAGTVGGTNSILLSENDGEPGADAAGHIHGRGFSASKPGLYVVTLQAYDAAGNGTGGGPIHSPSGLLPVYFQAGVTIAQLVRTNSQVAITFASRAGSSYYVQTTTTPGVSASWQNHAGPFTGNLLQSATALATNAASFYRLRVTTP